MTRMMLPALVFASPATAHDAGHVHAHGTDYAVLGLSLIALAALGLAAIRSR